MTLDADALLRNAANFMMTARAVIGERDGYGCVKAARLQRAIDEIAAVLAADEIPSVPDDDTLQPGRNVPAPRH